MNEKEKKQNRYIAVYKGREIEVYADTSYNAQRKASVMFKAKHSYDVDVYLNGEVHMSEL